jgi:hypothetical protein
MEETKKIAKEIAETFTALVVIVIIYVRILNENTIAKRFDRCVSKILRKIAKFAGI